MSEYINSTVSDHATLEWVELCIFNISIYILESSKTKVILRALVYNGKGWEGNRKRECRGNEKNNRQRN